MLQQAIAENIKPCLVINKIDRLILEKQLTPLEAYKQICRILEQINVIMSGLKAASMFKTNEDTGSVDLEHVDSENFFAPEKGNVAFACAMDGWGFKISTFANIFAKKLGAKPSVLQKALWGEHYMDPKTKKVYTKPPREGAKPMFVQCILDNIWQVYHAVHNEESSEKLQKIIKSLKLEVSQNILKKKNKQVTLQTIMRAWLPLSDAVLGMVVDILPSPIIAQRNRILQLMPDLQEIKSIQHDRKTDKQYIRKMREVRRKMKRNLLQCDKSEDAEIVVFVSKLLEVDTLPGAVSVDKHLQRKTYVKGKHKNLEATRTDSALAFALGASAETLTQLETSILNQKTDDKESPEITENSESTVGNSDETVDENENDVETDEEEEQQHFVGFARIFSGTIKVGQKVHILAPRYNSLIPDKNRVEFVVKNLYILMGRGLESVDQVPAGNVFGIGGVAKYILKSATITSSIYSPVFSAMYVQAAPIVRYAVEPKNLADMPALVKGLKLLNQADPSVEVVIQETGEHVVMTAGEVHAERCFRDLREKFARVPIIVSPPLVQFRETIVSVPGVKPKVVKVQTVNKQCTISIKAIPLPFNIARFIDDNRERLRKCLDVEKQKEKEGSEFVSMSVFDELKKEFEAAGEKWAAEYNNVWALGPKRIGPNVLLNHISGYQGKHFKSLFQRIKEDSTSGITTQDTESEKSEYVRKLHLIDNGIVTGFQLATTSGPLCDEPMMATAFCIESVEYKEEKEDAKKEELNKENTQENKQPESADSQKTETKYQRDFDSMGTFTGQVVSAVRSGCREAFNSGARRLVEAMYSCHVQANINTIGNVYAVLAKRRAKILGDDCEEGTGMITIKCLLPVAESFGLATEIRNQTGGAASPQLIFSHWEILDVDPFFIPKKKEEIEEFGIKDEVEKNIAKTYIDNVRKRKGLLVDEKLVKRPDAQRTLKKNK